MCLPAKLQHHIILPFSCYLYSFSRLFFSDIIGVQPKISSFGKQFEAQKLLQDTINIFDINCLFSAIGQSLPTFFHKP